MAKQSGAVGKRSLIEVGAGGEGVNNFLPKAQLGVKYVADAVNFDIDDAGLLRSRKGFMQVYAGNIHSLFSHKGISYFREADTLKSIQKIGPYYVAATLRSGIPTGRQRVWYVPVNDCIYYTDGVITGCIQNGTSRQWGIIPPPLPSIRNAQIGSLKDGTYLVALTYSRSDGYESGTVGVVRFDGAGGFYVDYVASSDPNITNINVYVSTRGADTLCLAYSTSNISGTFLYDGTGMLLSMPINTMFEYPPLAGQLIEYFYGYMLVARENVLFYSEPYRYESFRYESNFMVFDDRITLLCSVKDGLFVGTETGIHFLQGTDLPKITKYSVAGYGAIYGTQERGKPFADVVYCSSRRGQCKLSTGGTLENLTDGVVYFDTGDYGAGYYREQGGIIQYVATIAQPDEEGWDEYEQRIDIGIALPSLGMIDNVADVGLPIFQVSATMESS
ncbi:MAG: hypothetical protein HQK98_06515 [Nitrospirae bacterium]|nr:hypothetical protein [Nitrospirota bacterium]